jgi:Asp-tRNA(Asn)/Glu-tRNA(Gln) amidotransferase A subunit family amidase
LNDALAGTLASSGFSVEDVRLPSIFSAHQEIIGPILQSETATVHRRLFAEHRESYAPKIRAVIEAGLSVQAVDYVRAQRMRRRYQREMAKLFEKYDVLMTPSSPGTAPGIESTGNPVMNAPWTLTDFPTITLPHELGANGLPVGVQLVGSPMQEGLLVHLAKIIESKIGFSRMFSPPMF